MKLPVPESNGFVPPPHLSMEEYVAFVEEWLRHVDPEKIARQKRLEKQIKVAFRKIR